MSDQLPNALNKYTEINNAIKTASGGKKIKGFAKWLTYGIIIVAFAVGVIGSFGVGDFSMDAYTQFLPVAALFVVPLIISIGASSITEKVQTGKKDRETSVAAIATGGNPKPDEEAVG